MINWKKRYDRFYHPRHKFAYWHLAIDLILAAALATIIATNIYFLFHPNQYPSLPSARPSSQTVTASSSDSLAPLVQLTARLTLDATARYKISEGDQVGLGPLPPTVGQTTNYWIFLSLKTDYHSVKNIRVLAELPPAVTLTGRSAATSASPPAFDPETRKVSWQLDYLRPSDSELMPQGAAIEVSVTPTSTDAGRILTLLKDIRLNATDTKTGQDIAKTAADITTKIPEDENGGRVRTN